MNIETYFISGHVNREPYKQIEQEVRNKVWFYAKDAMLNRGELYEVMDALRDFLKPDPVLHVYLKSTQFLSYVY